MKNRRDEGEISYYKSKGQKYNELQFDYFAETWPYYIAYTVLVPVTLIEFYQTLYIFALFEFCLMWRQSFTFSYWSYNNYKLKFATQIESYIKFNVCNITIQNNIS